MHGYVTQPRDARRLQPNVRIEATGDGTVDDNLLLFVQQCDHFPFGPDCPLDASVDVVEEADGDE